MPTGYTNALIDRVRADIQHSQQRNTLLRSIGTSSSSPVGSSYSSVGARNLINPAKGMTTILSPNGQRVTVNINAAGIFSKLLQGLKALGYPVKDVQGYNYRNIAGTNILSKHATGMAIDVDPGPNRGSRLGTIGPRYGYFNPNKIIPLIKSLGLSWGGTWNNPDPMHFSIGEG